MIYFYSTEQDASNASFYRGTLFEDLLRSYLRRSGYEVDVSRRKTASLEYDLHGRHTVDNRPLIGEAKAHTETIGGKEVAAFVGKALPFLVQEPPYSAIFLSVSALSPEAEDYLRHLRGSTRFTVSVRCGIDLEAHIREVLTFPQDAMALAATRDAIPVPSSQSILHTNRGTFIAVVGAGTEGAFDDRFALVTQSNTAVSEVQFLQEVRSALPALQELEPIAGGTLPVGAPPSSIPRRDIPHGLITAADWLDYRKPAGSSFFVGRVDQLLKADDLASSATQGLVLEVKARSGVGKSSLLAVMAENFKANGHRVELHDARDVQSGEDVMRLGSVHN
jgi:hypothetical protein